jgi:DNA helicase IV
VTVLGDLAQATTPWATRSWDTALQHLGKPGAHVEQLTRGFRVPGEVIEFAARLLPVIAPGLEPPQSVRRARGELTVDRVSDPVAAVVQVLTATRDERVGSTGLIVPDPLVDELVGALVEAMLPHAVLGRDEPDGSVDVVPATLAKGLEFDHVVLVEPAALVAAEPDRTTGLRRLYVCLTRAVTSLRVVHADALPTELLPEVERSWAPG